MKEYKCYYFKGLPGESELMSGLNLPPANPPFRLVDCEIHPRLWEAIHQIYIPAGCEVVNSYVGPEKEV